MIPIEPCTFQKLLVMCVIFCMQINGKQYTSLPLDPQKAYRGSLTTQLYKWHVSSFLLPKENFVLFFPCPVPYSLVLPVQSLDYISLVDFSFLADLLQQPCKSPLWQLSANILPVNTFCCVHEFNWSQKGSSCPCNLTFSLPLLFGTQICISYCPIALIHKKKYLTNLSVRRFS